MRNFGMIKVNRRNKFGRDINSCNSNVDILSRDTNSCNGNIAQFRSNIISHNSNAYVNRHNTNKFTRNIVAAFICLAFVMCTGGCTKKTEAVIIDDGQDITETLVKEDVLNESSEKVFTYDDLIFGNVKFLMSENDVSSIIDAPDTIKEINTDTVKRADSYAAMDVNNDTKEAATDLDVAAERVYIYDSESLTFSQINGEYRLTSVESAKTGAEFSRGIKVGDSFDDILKVYYRDANCMNNILYSSDKTTPIGRVLYGDVTLEDLDSVNIQGNVEYGIINFNGYSSREEADEYIVEMTYFEPPYKSGAAGIEDDFAQIAFDIDKAGKITSIRWYYYPEQ